MSPFDILKTQCSFDATGTLAGRCFEHIEAVGADLPTILVVMRRVMGKFYKGHAARHMRLDAEYLAWDLPDGSVLMVAPRPGMVRAWPWFMALESRRAVDVIMSRPFPPVVEFSLGVIVHEMEDLGQKVGFG